MDQDEDLLATPRFRVVRRRQTLPDGTSHTREVILHPGAVVILPLLYPDRIIMIRNHRLAVQETLLELPAGTMELGEDPNVTAMRELEEETGYRASSLEFVQAFWMSPGILQERMHFYLATGLSQGHTQLDHGEQIEPIILDWSEVIRLVDVGEIQDAKTLVGLLWYDRRKK